MERKHLEAPELRSQHILELHRTVADLRAQLRAQEEVVALADHHREDTGKNCVLTVQLLALGINLSLLFASVQVRWTSRAAGNRCIEVEKHKRSALRPCC
jgi:hypothetical protein